MDEVSISSKYFSSKLILSNCSKEKFVGGCSDTDSENGCEKVWFKEKN